MMEAVPFTADRRNAEEVVDGYKVNGPTLEATQTLKDCRIQIEEEEEEIIVEEMRIGFKRWDKQTSTSLSGMHLGMYKSLTVLQEQEDEKILVLKVVTGLVNTALARGITLARWCKLHNLLLAKDPINPALHRLGIIHIIKANSNLATKILRARRFMRRADKRKRRFDSNWGARKGRNA